MRRDAATFYLLIALAFAETFVGFSEPHAVENPFLWMVFPLCFALISPSFLYLGPTLSTQMIAVLAITRLPEVPPGQILMVLCAAAALTQLLIPLFKKIPHLLSTLILESYAVGVGFWMLLFYLGLLLGLLPKFGHFQWLLEGLVAQWPKISMEHALIAQIPGIELFNIGLPELGTLFANLPFAFLISVAIVFDYIMARGLLGFEKQYPVGPSFFANVMGAFFGFVPLSISPLRVRLLMSRPLESRAVFLMGVPVLIGCAAIATWQIPIPVQLVAIFGIIATWTLWEPGRRFAKASQRKTDRLLSIMVMFQTMAWNLGLMIPFLFALEYLLKVFRRKKEVPFVVQQ